MRDALGAGDDRADGLSDKSFIDRIADSGDALAPACVVCRIGKTLRH